MKCLAQSQCFLIQQQLPWATNALGLGCPVGLGHKSLLPQSLHSSGHTVDLLRLCKCVCAAFPENLFKYLLLKQFLGVVSTKKWLIFWNSRTDPSRFHCSHQNNHLRRHILISVTGPKLKVFKFLLWNWFQSIQHNLLNILNAGKYLFGEEEFDVFGTKVIYTKVWVTTVDDQTGQKYYLSQTLEGHKSHRKEKSRITVYSLHTEAEGKILAVSGSLAPKLLKESMVSDF